MQKLKIAMIGVGAISGIYLDNIHGMFKDKLELVGVCDLIPERAQQAAEKYSVKKIYKDMHEAFADDEVQVVLNLTRPYEHFDVSMAAIKAGKHVYSEKPLSPVFSEGKALVEAAQQNNVLLGGAPDTFLGAGLQTCQALIERGFIGQPVGAAAFMICRGHESWHPDPEFYYKHGGGPLMDMGPYYLTALVNLLGGVKSVNGFAKTSFEQRTITSQPKSGQVIDVEVPTWVNGMLQFENGASGTIFTTFDVYYPGQARLEVYGSKGTLILPDPNCFDGPVKLFLPEDGELKEMPLMFGNKDNSRGIGLVGMADALFNGGKFPASCKQTLHVLEIMDKIIESAKKGSPLELETNIK